MRPRDVCSALLQALAAAEGGTRRRRRDQTPDEIGLRLKRTLLVRAVEADPAEDAFESWLFDQAHSTQASGPVQAMCLQIFEDYLWARLRPEFQAWLAAGAPSDDRTSRRSATECGCPPDLLDQR